MFITSTRHRRNALGQVLTVTTRFDPTWMAAREKYYYDIVFKQIVDDLAQQYREAGFVGGLSGLGFFGFFGKKPKAPPIPWGEIYKTAEPLARQYAKQYALQEEQLRIQEEGERIKQEKIGIVEKRSVEASSFKLPEGVIGVTRGALEMKVRGGPVETRISVPVRKK